MGDRESAQLCRPRRPRGSPIYHPTEEHLEPFDRVYDDRFASSYGFWRSEIERTLLGSLEQGTQRNTLSHRAARLYARRGRFGDGIPCSSLNHRVPAQSEATAMLNLSCLTRSAWPGTILGLALLLTGCREEGVRVYQVPKEQARVQNAATQGASTHGDSPHGADRPEAPNAHVHWESLPASWKERPVSGVMRAAEIGIRGEGGQAAELAVFALPEVRGMELEFLNMWREQISLEATTEAAIANLREEVIIAGQPGQLFDMAGGEPAEAGQVRQRIVVAMYSVDGTTWLFKLTGPEALVAGERDNLKRFLEKVGLHTKSPLDQNFATAAPPAAPATPASGSTAALPSGWKALTPGMMQTARFELPGGSQATVSTAGGDLLANVNRWRGQLQLEPIAASGLAEVTRPLTLANGSPATVVDMSGAEDRMVTVIVPRGAQSVFYKLMGPPENVARDREAFLQFAQSAQY